MIWSGVCAKAVEAASCCFHLLNNWGEDDLHFYAKGKVGRDQEKSKRYICVCVNETWKKMGNQQEEASPWRRR